jgi:hypothetical protein
MTTKHSFGKESFYITDNSTDDSTLHLDDFALHWMGKGFTSENEFWRDHFTTYDIGSSDATTYKVEAKTAISKIAQFYRALKASSTVGTLTSKAIGNIANLLDKNIVDFGAAMRGSSVVRVSEQVVDGRRLIKYSVDPSDPISRSNIESIIGKKAISPQRNAIHIPGFDIPGVNSRKSLGDALLRANIDKSSAAQVNIADDFINTSSNARKATLTYETGDLVAAVNANTAEVKKLIDKISDSSARTSIDDLLKKNGADLTDLDLKQMSSTLEKYGSGKARSLGQRMSKGAKNTYGFLKKATGVSLLAAGAVITAKIIKENMDIQNGCWLYKSPNTFIKVLDLSCKNPDEIAVQKTLLDAKGIAYTHYMPDQTATPTTANLINLCTNGIAADMMCMASEDIENMVPKPPDGMFSAGICGGIEGKGDSCVKDQDCIFDGFGRGALEVPGNPKSPSWPVPYTFTRDLPTNGQPIDGKMYGTFKFNDKCDNCTECADTSKGSCNEDSVCSNACNADFPIRDFGLKWGENPPDDGSPPYAMICRQIDWFDSTNDLVGELADGIQDTVKGIWNTIIYIFIGFLVYMIISGIVRHRHSDD